MSEHEEWYSDTNIKLGSPMTSRHLKTCLSFASIKQHKNIRLQQLETPRHSVSKNTVLYRTSEKENLIETRTSNKDYAKNGGKREEMTKQQKSAIKENSKILIETYQVQNESLKQTVEILKQQVSALAASYSALKQQHAAEKQQMQDNQQVLLQYRSQLQQYKAKEKQYESIIPKIEQLEHLQDGMIEENNRYKEREQVLKDLLAQIIISIGESTDQTALHVRTLINERCRKL